MASSQVSELEEKLTKLVDEKDSLSRQMKSENESLQDSIEKL
jgi:hypothetical protein